MAFTLGLGYHPREAPQSPQLSSIIAKIRGNMARDLANRVRSGDTPNNVVAMDACIARDEAIIRAEWSACVARVVANCIRLR